MLYYDSVISCVIIVLTSLIFESPGIVLNENIKLIWNRGKCLAFKITYSFHNDIIGSSELKLTFRVAFWNVALLSRLFLHFWGPREHLRILTTQSYLLDVSQYFVCHFQHLLLWEMLKHKICSIVSGNLWGTMDTTLNSHILFN